jgi:hypothetical protein
MARSLKAVAAAAEAAKDRRFRAFQEGLGLSSDNDGEASVQSPLQKAAARCPVAQSPQQRKDGAPGKRVAQVELDPSSLVPIPTLPLHLQTLVPNSLGSAGQDTRSTKLPESPGPSCSPYIKSSPCRLGSGDQMGHVAPGTPPCSQCRTLFFRQSNSGLPVRTKTCAQHAAAVSPGSRVEGVLSV